MGIVGKGYLFDPELAAETGRLILLDRMLTRCMGGPLVGVSEDFVLSNVLDVACGPGSWVLDVAFALADVEVAGIDSSQTMVDYAYARARTQRLSNASFGVMDLTEPLDFAEGAFDLVNGSFLVSRLKQEQRALLLKECFRLLRPGGIMRLVEIHGGTTSTSPSLSRLQQQLTQRKRQEGYGFPFDDGFQAGITLALLSLLETAGFQEGMLTPFILNTSHEQESWLDFLHLAEITYSLAWEHRLLEDDAYALIQYMLAEIQQCNFYAITYGSIVCAKKPLAIV
jgi:SAM-dependent methyltransferase